MYNASSLAYHLSPTFGIIFSYTWGKEVNVFVINNVDNSQNISPWNVNFLKEFVSKIDRREMTVAMLKVLVLFLAARATAF